MQLDIYKEAHYTARSMSILSKKKNVVMYWKIVACQQKDKHDPKKLDF